jgi:hypothetical protein
MARAAARWWERVRALASVALLGAVAMGATACGPLTIRTWVTIVEDQSSGQIKTGSGAPVAIGRLQGGFLAKVKIDTTQLLSGPLHGTIELEKIRIAGQAPGGIGTICTWGNPAVSSAGTVTLDLVGGASSADLDLAIKASTFLNQLFNLPPVELNQPVSFDLGSGLSLDQLAAAAADGSADGLFATEAAFEGSSVIGTLPVTFSLDLDVTNVSTPPVFDADLLASCASKFAEQGNELYFGLNSKSSYLQAKLGDDPMAPLVVSLADVGAAPGDTLRLERVATYSDVTELKDGTETGLTGIFSSTDEVRRASYRIRVPGAIDAGPNVKTGWWACPLLCFISTDVPQDFPIGTRTDVVVPAGAAYLIVAPLPRSYFWSDDSGFGFGVDVTVNPEP